MDRQWVKNEKKKEEEKSRAIMKMCVVWKRGGWQKGVVERIAASFACYIFSLAHANTDDSKSTHRHKQIQTKTYWTQNRIKWWKVNKWMGRKSCFVISPLWGGCWEGWRVGCDDVEKAMLCCHEVERNIYGEKFQERERVLKEKEREERK